MMSFAAAYLVLGGIGTIGFGIAYAVRTQPMARMVGIEVSSASARADYRAIYAGSQIGVGVFFLLTAWRPLWLQAGLAALALFAGGFGIVRLSSLAAERAHWQFQWIVGVLEIIAGTIAAWLLGRGVAS